MKKIQCIHMDFDGTLSNSIASLKNAYFYFLESHHLNLEDIDFESLNGLTLIEIVKKIKCYFGLKKDIDELHTSYLSIIQNTYQNTGPNEGAVELLEYAHKKNIRIHIVTSNSQSVVSQWLAANQLSQYISDIIDINVSQQGKSTPEPFLISIKRSKKACEYSIAVEDSQMGALSAAHAGLKTYLLHQNNSIANTFSSELIFPIQSLLDLKTIL